MRREREGTVLAFVCVCVYVCARSCACSVSEKLKYNQARDLMSSLEDGFIVEQ